MNPHNDRNCLFMGLPNSGKSTFIGALWHILESKEIPSSLMIEAEPDNREYLNKLREAWLKYEAPGRTSGQYKPLEFQIKQDGKEGSFMFNFPDVSGELYESQFEHRSLSTDYHKLVSSCSGVLLFINPDYVRAPNLITDVDDIEKSKEEFFAEIFKKAQELKKVASESDVVDEGQGEKENTRTKEIKWKHQYSQTQVKIIDLLQMIVPFIRRPCRIAFIISAWDVIMEANQLQPIKLTPAKWFATQVPLLHQFMLSNADSFMYDVFGVSAQGGSYKKDKVEQLYGLTSPSERVVVQYGNDLGKDITLPIKWLLNE